MYRDLRFIERSAPILETVWGAPPSVHGFLAQFASEAADYGRLPFLRCAVDGRARRATEINANFAGISHAGLAAGKGGIQPIATGRGNWRLADCQKRNRRRAITLRLAALPAPTASTGRLLKGNGILRGGFLGCREMPRMSAYVGHRGGGLYCDSHGDGGAGAALRRRAVS